MKLAPSVEKYTRQEIKEGLTQLSDKHVDIFKRMYSPDNLSLDIDTVVENIPNERLNWALVQVTNSVNKLQEN